MKPKYWLCNKQKYIYLYMIKMNMQGKLGISYSCGIYKKNLARFGISCPLNS